MPTSLVGARIFDGEAMLEGYTVVLEGDRIAAVEPGGRVPAAGHPVDCGGFLLAPGFVDVQVNGGGGVLFNDAPTVETLEIMSTAHRRFGTTGMVATLVSDTWDKMVAAADAVAAARAAGVPGILGIHFEGPCLHPGRRGIHPRGHLRGVDPGLLERVSKGDLGSVVVTLAPECVPAGTIASLVAAGVRVSLGHTMASYEQVIAALDEGATGFTHLFNAMPPLRSRAPGIVGAALSDPRGYRGIIVDGHHVSPITLGIALRAQSPRSMMLVTDAMPTVGTDLEAFDLLGEPVKRRAGRLITGDGTLAGADLEMATAVRNAVELLGLSEGEALAMASRQPAAFLGRAAERGRIVPGHRADLVLLDQRLRVVRVWVDGREWSARSGPVIRSGR